VEQTLDRFKNLQVLVALTKKMEKGSTEGTMSCTKTSMDLWLWVSFTWSA